MYMNKFYVNINGNNVEVCKIKGDVNGNPRYIIHYLSITDNYNNKKLQKAGFKKYSAKWYGGGLIFSSYNVESDLKYMYNFVNDIK